MLVCQSVRLTRTSHNNSSQGSWSPEAGWASARRR